MSKKSGKGRASLWICMVFLLGFVALFCVASYKVGFQLLTEHKENQGFEELIAQVEADRAQAAGGDPSASGGSATTATGSFLNSFVDTILDWYYGVAANSSGDAANRYYGGVAVSSAADSSEDAASDAPEDAAEGSSGEAVASASDGAAADVAEGDAAEPADITSSPLFGVPAEIVGGEYRLLPDYATLYAANPELFGWIEIEGTAVNYPVMHTPKDPERYLHRAFDGSYSFSGVPFMDAGCYYGCGNYILYGHHMKNGTMFASIVNYANKEYWEEHPVIRFDTLYERGTYKVLAVMYSRVYKSYEKNVFRYYDYKDLSDPMAFTEYVRQVRRAALYNTGVDVEYGDQLITLSTCEYSAENGRFVVVARKVRAGEELDELSEPDESGESDEPDATSASPES